MPEVIKKEKDVVRVSHPGASRAEEFLLDETPGGPKAAVKKYRDIHGKIDSNHPYRVEVKGREFFVTSSDLDKDEESEKQEKKPKE